MPITSPVATRNEISFNAQNVRVPLVPPAICLKRRHGPVTHDVIDSPSVASPIGVVPIVYCLPSFSITTASDDIGEPALDLKKVTDPHCEHHQRRDAGDEDHPYRERAAEHTGPEAGDHPDHRV